MAIRKRYPKRRFGRVVRRKVRRYAGRGQYMVKRVSYGLSKKGFLKLYRKLPEIFIQNGIASGTIQTNDPTGTCLTTGTPILEANNLTYSIPFVMKFCLSQIINSTDITNLCDAYKLKYVSIKCQYLKNTASSTSIGVSPSIMWIQDHDDNSLPTSVDAIREKMGVRVKRFGMNQEFKIGLSPRVADTVFNTGLPPAYAVAKPMWINSTYPNTSHYAIKGVFTNVPLFSSSNTTTQFNFDITTLVYGKDFQ